MNKNKMMAIITLLCIPASLICFYATNLILSDVANMFYMTLTKDVISSIPIFVAAAEFTVVLMAAFRICLHPDNREYIFKLNAMAVIFLSLCGAVCAALSGTVIYGSFIAPYPFPAAIILTCVLHAGIFTAAVITAIKYRSAVKPEKSVLKCILQTIEWMITAVLVYYAFDRFGAVLCMPLYLQLSMSFKMLLFGASLLLPALLLLHYCRYRLGLYAKIERAGMLYPAAYFAANLLLNGSVIYFGMKDTQFVSAISPALGIERLLGKPIITIIHVGLLAILAIACFAAALHAAIKKRTAEC